MAVEAQLHGDSRTLRATAELTNGTQKAWSVENGYFAGAQVFDGVSRALVAEGEWQRIDQPVAPGERRRFEFELVLPRERGRYQIYASILHREHGWLYQAGQPFLLVEAEVDHGRAELRAATLTTLQSLRRRDLLAAARKALTLPFTSVWRNRSLIRSMVRRDVLSRYRGSFGDVLWTVLNPLLLMATYFFVFGIVLQSRFEPDQSRTAFALYFLAGMLPWIAFSEAVGRSPQVVIEHRNFVKKLVFPVETLPVNHVLSGLVTQVFALAVFLIALIAVRGSVPAAAALLPLLVFPQVLLTAGTAWFLAATGVYLRDLGQVVGFLLTLLFFLTPICYPETSLPDRALAVLSKNPIYVLVRGYRTVLLDGNSPLTPALAKLWLVSVVVFIGGYAWFHKLRKSFADVI